MKETAESIGKALLAAIPYVGGSITTLISDYQANRKQERLSEFFHLLQNDLGALKDHINKSFISTDDFLDVFEETSKKIVNERTMEKRIAFKNILLNAILLENITYDRVEEFLRILERLRPDHLFFLSIFFDPLKFNKEKGNPVSNGGGFSTTLRSIFKQLLPDWEEDKILDIVSDLENERLVKDTVRNFGTMMTDRGINHLQGKLSDKGMEFCKFILE